MQNNLFQNEAKMLLGDIILHKNSWVKFIFYNSDQCEEGLNAL